MKILVDGNFHPHRAHLQGGEGKESQRVSISQWLKPPHIEVHPPEITVPTQIHPIFTTQIRTLSAPWPYLSFFDTLE